MSDDDITAEELRARRRMLRERYGSFYDEVLAILFRHDPMELDYETNTDEYEDEAATILPRLAEAAGAADVGKIVHQEFLRHFSRDAVGDDSRYGAIADDIWAAYARFKTGDKRDPR